MKSFRDPVTNVLKAFGHCDTNAPSDLGRDEPEDFSLTPGEWQLINDVWVAYIDSVALTKAQIDALENPPMYMRMLRETALVCIEDLATRLAEQMTENGTPTTQADILDNQIGYQKAKALDDQIRALRAQL